MRVGDGLEQRDGSKLNVMPQNLRHAIKCY